MSHCLNPRCSAPTNNHTASTCATCQTPLTLNHRYQAIKTLGQGGFGRTFVGVDITHELKHRCVIKQLFPQQHDRESRGKALALFHHEARQLKELGAHPQIPELYVSFEQDGYHYLIQELIHGQNLAEELVQVEAYTEFQIWQLLDDVVPVLQFLHDNHVIHRDIKPANIIRRQSDRQLFLVDLGASKQATGTALVLTGTVIGSAEYTAPEQARGKATFASDIYSLGVTCIHLLTGISPFNLYDSGEGTWVWQDFLNHPVSDGLSQLLDKMILQPTNHRYQTVDELQLAIQKHRQRSPNRDVSHESIRQTDRIQQTDGLTSGNDKSVAAYADEAPPKLLNVFPLKPSNQTTLSILKQSAILAEKTGQNPTQDSQSKRTLKNRNQASQSPKVAKRYLLPVILQLAAFVGLSVLLNAPKIRLSGKRSYYPAPVYRPRPLKKPTFKPSVSQSTEAVIIAMSSNSLTKEDERALKIINTMNEAQKQYFREYNTFEWKAFSRDIGTYSFSSSAISPSEKASSEPVQVAISNANQPDMGVYRSYIGAVRVLKSGTTLEDTIFETVLCEAKEPPIDGGVTDALVLYLADGPLACPNGYRHLEKG